MGERGSHYFRVHAGYLVFGAEHEKTDRKDGEKQDQRDHRGGPGEIAVNQIKADRGQRRQPAGKRHANVFFIAGDGRFRFLEAAAEPVFPGGAHLRLAGAAGCLRGG